MVETVERAILLADVSESSQLFREVGDASAVALVGQCIDRMIEICEAMGGIFVHSRGDDVLAVFADPLAAKNAAHAMLSACPVGRVAVHAGLHWGPVILARGEAFGDAVNLAARLSSLANSGEALISADLVGRLSPADCADLRPMDRLLLKGMDAPVEVFAQILPPRSHVGAVTYTGRRRETPRRPQGGLVVHLSHGDTRIDLLEGTEYVLGRSPECNLVLFDQWISRRHGIVNVRRGLVEYRDVSSTGSYIRIGDGDEYYLNRQTVLLSTSGTIAPGRSSDAPHAQLIHFEIRREGAIQA